jgi:NAD(P)-dependent dehydrogenase (short-subunit alcohol dehydrogenase family)
LGELDGKVALVTGGGRGVGRGIALALAKEGADVTVSGRRRESLDQVVAEIGETGQRGLAVACDVGDEAQVQQMVASTVDEFGRLDILVNNAQSWGPPAELAVRPPIISLQEIPEEWWDHTLQTGLKATFYCCRAAFPYLQERGGKVVNLGSHAGWGAAQFPDYSAAKAGIVGLSRSIARQWAEYGINVNILIPRIDSDSSRAFADEYPDLETASTNASAIVREGPRGDPERDAGAVVVFMCSPESDAITGQLFIVNGGLLMV